MNKLRQDFSYKEKTFAELSPEPQHEAARWRPTSIEAPVKLSKFSPRLTPVSGRATSAGGLSHCGYKGLKSAENKLTHCGRESL